MLDAIVLGLLEAEPLTGYDLKKRMEGGLGVFYRASYGSLYPLLRRLAAGGEVQVTEQAEGKRQKKIYHITQKGRDRFKAWLRQPVDVREADNLRLAKIYFFDRLPKPEQQRQLALYEDTTQAYLRELRDTLERLRPFAGDARHYFKMSTLYYGIASLEQTLRWCAHIRAGKPLEGLLEG